MRSIVGRTSSRFWAKNCSTGSSKESHRRPPPTGYRTSARSRVVARAVDLEVIVCDYAQNRGGIGSDRANWSPMDQTFGQASDSSDDQIEGGPWIDDANPALAARALFLGIFLLMAGNGLQGSLLGVRSEAEGFGLTVTGLVMAAYFAGFLAGSKYAEHLLSRVGHIRVFAGLASVASSAVLVHALFVSPITWGLMRFVSGMCMAGLYVVAESWLNDLATNATRGRLLSVYMVASMGGLASGQFMLDLANPDGFELFVLSSILVSASLVPVVLSASSSPPISVPEPLSLRDLIRLVPTGVVSSFWVGTAAGVLMGLSAVYAVNVELSSGHLTSFLAAPLVGSVVLQWPIGYISDRMSRRGVMFWVAAAATVFGAVLTIVPVGGWVAIGLMFLIGGMSFPLYSLAIGYTADWLPVSKLNGASAALVRANGVGAVLGPLLGAAAMASLDPSAFFWTLAFSHGVVAVYIGYRIVVAEAPPVDRHRRFVAIPARASSVALNLIARRRHASAATPKP